MKKAVMFIFIFFSFVLQSKAQKESIVNIDKASSTDIFTDVDQKPTFFDGKESLEEFYKKNSQYKICDKGEEGCKTLYYQIVIDTAGNAGSFNLVRGINEEFNTEAEKIVNQMPSWTPGKKDGKIVKVLITLDMRFKLQ